MKSKIKNCVFWVLGVSFLFLTGCSEEIYENHLHGGNKKIDNSISFKRFLNETNLIDFKNTKRFNSSNIEGAQSRLIGLEFYIDTTRIFRNTAPDNKITYSFRAFPLSGTVEPNSYYNIVYEKIGTQWNEVIFLNKEKSNPTDARKLESSNMIYNRLSSHGALGFTEVITTSIQCNGSCSGACDGFACPTGECIKTTVTYVYTGIADTGGGFNGNPGDPGNGNTGSGGGGGDAYGGIFIPNPYSNSGDPLDPDFILDGQISSFVNSIAIQNPNIATLLSTNLWLHPHINQFIRNNAGLNFANKTAVRNALETLQLVTAINISNNSVINIYQSYLDIFLFSLHNPDAANKTFILELANLAIPDNDFDQNAFSFVLQAKSQDKYNNDLDADFLVSVDNLIDLDMSNPENIDPFIQYLIMKIAITKVQNPTWSNAKVFWVSSKGIIHIVLDGFGLIPVVGEIADLTNGVLYVVEGDGVNAAFSFGSAIPFVGWAGPTAKYAIKIKTAYQSSNKYKLVWKVLANGDIYFGTANTCRAQLRKALNLLSGNTLIAHHIIPISLQSNPVVQKAFKSAEALHLNEALNGIPLTSAVHSGSHANYTTAIFEKLDEYNLLNPNASLSQCYTFVSGLIQDVRNWVVAHPNTNINLITLP